VLSRIAPGLARKTKTQSRNVGDMMLVQLGTDCKLELMTGGENVEHYDVVWHSSSCSDSGILWVSLHCQLHSLLFSSECTFVVLTVNLLLEHQMSSVKPFLQHCLTA